MEGAFFMSQKITVTPKPYDLDPADMAIRGRIGGLTTHARHDSREITAPARQAFKDRFLTLVDPDNSLPELERLKRAEAARRAHYTRLARLSAIARASKKATQAD